MPRAFTAACIVDRLRVSVEDSTRTAGVGMSARFMSGSMLNAQCSMPKGPSRRGLGIRHSAFGIWHRHDSERLCGPESGKNAARVGDAEAAHHFVEHRAEVGGDRQVAAVVA